MSMPTDPAAIDWPTGVIPVATDHPWHHGREPIVHALVIGTDRRPHTGCHTVVMNLQPATADQLERGRLCKRCERRATGNGRPLVMP